MARQLAPGFLLVCLSSAEVIACPGTYAESTIIFDDVPISLDPAVVIEVTISDMSRITDPSGVVWAVMNARVDKVIRGAISVKTLKIVTVVTSCTKGFGAGSHGIVVGTLRNHGQGTPELIAIQESQSERAVRKIREQDK